MNRFVMATAVGVGVGLGMSMGLAVPARADGYWAAIAYSGTANSVHTSYGRQTQAQAEQDALRQCSAKYGNDCVILASSANCVAVTFDGSGMQGGTGTTAQAAINDALARSASGATVKDSTCSTDP
jgi:hypothetical protein